MRIVNRDNSFPQLHMRNCQNLRLYQFVQMMSVDYDDKTVVGLTKDFCLDLTNEEDLRIGMKFLYLHGYYNELEILINKNKKSTHSLNRVWAAIFKLSLKRINREVPHYELLNQLNEIKSEDNDTICLILINKINVLFNIFAYGDSRDDIDHLQCRIYDVKDPLLNELYQYCLESLLFVFYWKRNELILARKYGFRTLNKTFNKAMKAHIHFNLSLTYIYEDYESSMYHLREARQLAIGHKEDWLLKMIDHQAYPFICAQFNRTEGVVAKDASEQAHLEIVRGNLENAQKILAGITEVTPYTKYYLGRAHQDRKYLNESYNDFIEKQSDHFFARLPLLAMKDL